MSLTLAGTLRAGLALLFVALVLAVFPWSEDPTGPVKWLILALGVFACVSVLLIVTWLKDRPLRRPGTAFWLWAGLLGVSILAAAAAPLPAYSLIEVRRLTVLVFLCLVSTQVFSRPAHLRAFLGVVCGAAALACLYAFAQGCGVDFIAWRYTSSSGAALLPGTFGNPNYASHMLVLCLIGAVYLAAHRGWRWAFGFALIYGVYIVWIRHRGGMAALAVAGALVGIAKILARSNRPALRKAITTLAALSALMGIAIGVVFGVTYARTGAFLPVDSSLYSRYHGYAGAVRMIQDRPWLGFGPGNYQIFSPEYWTRFEQERFVQSRAVNNHVHNDVLEVAVDTGIPSAILYLSLFCFTILAGLHRSFADPDPEARRAGLFFAAFFCAFAVDGFFGFNIRLPASAALFAVVLGAFDGLSARTPVTSGLVWRSTYVALVRRWIVLFAALVCVILEARVFVSDVLHFVGRNAAEQDQHVLAEAAFGRAEQFAPWNWKLPAEQGAAALVQGRYDKAVAHFNRALMRNPNDLMSLVNLANVQLQRGLMPGRDGDSRRDAELQREALQEAQFFARRALDLCPLLPEAEDLESRATFFLVNR